MTRSLQQRLEAEEQRRRAREAANQAPTLEGAIAWLQNTFTTIAPKVQNLFGDLKAKSAFSHVGEFSSDLLRPLHRIQTVNIDGFISELKDTIKLDPHSPLSGFVLWNTLAFWLGIAEDVRLAPATQR